MSGPTTTPPLTTSAQPNRPFDAVGASPGSSGPLRHGGVRRTLIAVGVLLLLAAGITALSLSGRSPTAISGSALNPLIQARHDARAFLTRYVDPDGRVVRRDQGGDTVSEGQAYALLLSVAIGDRSEFARVWNWEQQNLQQPDNLFAYRWADGAVASQEPATDADLDTAWALELAGRDFNDSEYETDGIAVAGAVLADETVSMAGRIELVAGPWARNTPATIDASYISPEAMSSLATASGDTRWLQLESDSTTLVSSLEDAAPSRLPSDWSALAADGSISPTGAPSTNSAPAYGLDAQRVPAWFAADCNPAGRRLSSALWPTLRSAPGKGADISYSPSGRPETTLVNPLGYVAAAAAADAAGHSKSAAALLTRADHQSAAHHTYYGDAWVALGRVLLDTSWLSTCPPGA